jgi:hypothetical protein
LLTYPSIWHTLYHTFAENNKSEDIMSPEYLVINCQFWDSTSDYYDQLINLAEDYLDKTDEPTVTGFNNYIIHNN